MALDIANWKPLSLTEVAELLGQASFPWWIAGGHAVELTVGRSLRDHGDMDILVLRKDHQAVRELLADWDCWASEGELRPWPQGEILHPAIHNIWCRENPEGPWRLQIMLDESDGTDWYSRRDSRVKLSLSQFGALSREGIPFVTPEVTIFYKAKKSRPKDEFDFATLLEELTTDQRHWAAQAIRMTCGAAHPWIARLEARR